MLRVTIIALAAALAAAAQDSPPVPKNNPYTSEADVARGKALFGGQCAPCHGPAGEGGRGAHLARPKLPRAGDDAALFKVIGEGLPGTGMPGAWALNDHEKWQVAAFVRTLGRTAVETNLPGDAARGRVLFRGKGKCMGCHSVAGEGGVLGPPLTEAGMRRSAAFLREKLLNPEAGVPEDFARVEVAARTGQRLSGIRMNEDTYSIQFRDLSGRLHSFWKSDLAELKKDRTRTPMPSYRAVFTAGELDDVAAYLASLRGNL